MAKKQEDAATDLSAVLEPPRMTILSDHPILRPEEDEDNREPDSFGLHSRLGAVYDIIRHKNTRAPLAIAIYGDWGTGKSSAMRWLSDALGQWSKQSKGERGGHHRARTVWFDPWKYTKREDVWRGLIAEVILKAIDVRGASLETVTKAAREFGFFLGRSFLNILSGIKLKVAGKANARVAQAKGDATIDLAMLTKIADDYRQTSHPEKAFLNEFETALREWVKASLGENQRMVLFIDDLDRCLPEVVLEVLEALKLYLNIPQLIFVVGLDRDVVESVVTQHYKEHGLGATKAKHYLDKMFQVEVDVPPSPMLMADYIQGQIEALDDVTDGYWSTSLSKWNSAYESIIERKIADLAEHNPREVKRLLNSTLLRATAAARHDSLDGEIVDDLDIETRRARRFTQGCQVYLIQCFVKKYVPNSGGLLREDEVLKFLEAWSKFIADYPDFPRPGKGREDKTQEDASGKQAGLSQDAAIKARAALRDSAPRYRDEKAEVIPLLDQPDLWDLLAIPFSVAVGAAAVVVDADEGSKSPSTSDTSEAEATPSDEAVKTQAQAGPTHAKTPKPKRAAEARSLARMSPTLRSAIARELGKPVDAIQAEDLRRVRELDLSGSDITDAGLEHLSALTGLQNLDLNRTKITDAGLKHLSALTALHTLLLEGTQITDAGLKHLSVLTGLQNLDLDRTKITDAGLKHLSALTGLQNLDLNRTKITDAGLKHLSALTALQTLSLDSTQVTDAGLKHLSVLTGLQNLDLDQTQITDAGLGHLDGCESLTGLYTNGTQVTYEAKRRFMESREPE